MSYHFENVRLEKGMYGQSGKSFTRTLEELDPSERYRGTPLEGLDAFQRQLKRFDIHVKGADSDQVEKFFHTTESSVLFPEFVSRVVRQGLEEEGILPHITATVTKFDGMDYRSIAANPTEDDKKLLPVEEGKAIPETVLKTQENLVKLHKRGRAAGPLFRHAAPDRRVHRQNALAGRGQGAAGRRRQPESRRSRQRQRRADL